MSGDTEATQIIAEAASDQVIFYMNAVSGALLAYEYLITFDREVSLFWVQKITMASVLFMVNRYIALCAGMIGLPIEVTSQICREAFNYIDAVFEISQYIPWAVFSALRAFALSSRTTPLALVVFLLSLGPIVINLVIMGHSVIRNDVASCGLVPELPVDILHKLAIVSRSTLVSADLLVLAITWKATFKASRDDIRAFGQRTSLSAILFRDGVTYFVTLVILNVLHLIFTLLSIANSGDSRFTSPSSVASLLEPLTAILMSRFLIDLQEANNAILHQGSITSMGTSAFNRFIGSLGTPLPAPNFASESASVYEHEGQPEGHSGGGREAVAASPVE